MNYRFRPRVALIIIPIVWIALWVILPLLGGSTKFQLITISAASEMALLWFGISVTLTALIIVRIGWMTRSRRLFSFLFFLVFALLVLFVMWVIFPNTGLGGNLARRQPIVITAINQKALDWFSGATWLTIFSLVWFGRAYAGAHLIRRVHERVLLLTHDQLEEGVALYSRRKRPVWINSAGERYLFQDGKLSPMLGKSIERVIETRRVATQSITLNESVRVNVQITPLDDGTISLVARQLHNEADATKFYERFIRRIVHDMRNPLAAIIAHSSNLYTAQSTDLAALQNTARTIESEAQRLTRLVDSMLFDARLAYVPLAAEPLDLVEVIEEVMFQQDERAIQEGKSIEVETPTERAPIQADRDLLVRALSNLVDNSLKYSQSGTLVKLSLERIEKNYLIQVQDNGDGIPPEFLPDRIFEPLVRARSKDGGSGSGLGLSIVRKIIEMHGGTIGASSSTDAPNRGTIMTIRLPQ